MDPVLWKEDLSEAKEVYFFLHTSSVAILAQAISCSNVRMNFLRHELFWFCLVQVSTTQCCCFQPVLNARVDDGLDVPIFPIPAIHSIDAHFNELRDMVLPLVRGFTDFENHVKTISVAVGFVTARITIVEQIVHTLSATVSFAEMEQSVNPPFHRMSALSLHASARSKKVLSSVSGSARSWPSPGQFEGSTAAGSHAPGSSDDNKNPKRRLDILSNSDDENT